MFEGRAIGTEASGQRVRPTPNSRRTYLPWARRVLGVGVILLFFWPTWFIRVPDYETENRVRGFLPAINVSGFELLQFRLGMGRDAWWLPWTFPTRAYLSSDKNERRHALVTVEAIWWGIVLIVIPASAAASAVVTPGNRVHACSSILACGGATAVLCRAVIPWGIFTRSAFVDETMPDEAIEFVFASLPVAVAVAAASGLALRRPWRDWPILLLAGTCVLTSLVVPFLDPKRGFAVVPVGQQMRLGFYALTLSVASIALLATRWFDQGKNLPVGGEALEPIARIEGTR